LTPRNAHESCRTASPLELFFDLVFVVAVAFASQSLHHFATEGHVSTGLQRYLLVFFAIWWPWMNFTWFASAYDSDDWLYRILSLVQMLGALVIAAGVPSAMDDFDFTVMFVGYIVMRLSLVAQWLRVAVGDPERRTTALRFAGGVAAVQLYWVAFQFVPSSSLVTVYIIGMIGELAVPIIAERSNNTPWHPHHIAERYGLFTMIVLGESILASSLTIVDAIEKADHYGDLIALALTGFVIVAGMWWIYFSFDQSPRLGRLRTGIKWGYSHYVIFASAAAVSAGIEVAVDYSTHHTELTEARAAAILCVPVAAFILGAWLILIRPNADKLVNSATPITAGLVLVAAFIPFSAQIVAALMVGLVVLITLRAGEVTVHGHAGELSTNRDARYVAAWSWRRTVRPGTVASEPPVRRLGTRSVRIRPSPRGQLPS
jgi:low temperature requirement protein LtrA